LQTFDSKQIYFKCRNNNTVNQSPLPPFPPLRAAAEVCVLVDVLVAPTEVLVDIEVLEVDDALRTVGATVDALVGNDVRMVDDVTDALVDSGVVVAMAAAAALVDLEVVVDDVASDTAMVDFAVVLVVIDAAAALVFDIDAVVVSAAPILTDVKCTVDDASEFEAPPELDGGVVDREDVAAGLVTMVGAVPLIDSNKVVDATADAVS
jgi:hypothetical protein